MPINANVFMPEQTYDPTDHSRTTRPRIGRSDEGQTRPRQLRGNWFGRSGDSYLPGCCGARNRLRSRNRLSERFFENSPLDIAVAPVFFGLGPPRCNELTGVTPGASRRPWHHSEPRPLPPL